MHESTVLRLKVFPIVAQGETIALLAIGIEMSSFLDQLADQLSVEYKIFLVGFPYIKYQTTLFFHQSPVDFECLPLFLMS